MRDDSILEREIAADQAPTLWRGRTATAIGALCSLVILMAVVIWSYRLGVRDAAEIPVIRAEIEATKSRPGEPGGLVVDHQDRVVYGVVSGTDGAGQAVLAAPAEGLADEDIAPSAISPAPAPRPAPDPNAEVVVATPDTVAPAPAPVAVAPVPSAETPGEPLAENLANTGEVETALAELEADEQEAFAAGAAPRTAPIAKPRPTRVAAPATSTPVAEPAEPRAAALASTIQIQLGAFESEAVAAQQWEAIKGRNSDLLAGKGRVVTPVLSGGKRLFRLRAGPFETVAQASALCRGLKGRDEACIVARAR